MKIKIIGIIFICLLMTSCQNDEKNSLEKPREKILITSLSARPKNLDPTTGNEIHAITITDQIYDTLLKVNEKGEIENDLAESYSYSSPTELNIKIRKGIKFHNGDDLKIGDVAFSLDRMRNQAGTKYLVNAIKSIKITGEYELKIKLKFPSAPLLYTLTTPQAGIMSEAYVKKVGEEVSLYPMGTGPFKYISWGDGEKIELEANKNYFLGAPKIDKLIYRVITESSSRLAALETGSIHIANPISPIDSEIVRKNDELKEFLYSTTAVDFISFNTEKKPFDNVLFRKAIHYAINKKGIVDSVYLGKSEVAKSIVNPTLFASDQTTGKIEYNPEKAKELLEKSGVEVKTFTLMTSDSHNRIQAVQIIQDNLKEIGIDVNIEILEWGRYLQATAQGDYDIFLGGWGTATVDPDGVLFTLLHSSTIGGGGNKSRYSNPEYDKLVEAGRTATTPEKRIEVYKKAQEIIAEDNPLIPLYYNKEDLGISKKVENFIPSPNIIHQFLNVDLKF